jgi:hypothetical protein
MKNERIEPWTTSAGDKPWYLSPYFLLSLTLMLVTTIYPLAQAQNNTLLHDVVISAMLISAMYAVNDKKTIFRILALLLLPMLLGTWALESDAQSVLSKLSAILTMAYLVVTLATVFIHVIVAQKIDANMIFDSVAVYLLVGIIVALMLLYLHNTNPGSVLGSLNNTDPWGGGSDNFAVLLYFSTITLTSVGYGDMVPVGSAAKSVAMFTGVFGQLYVAILVAKLVGVHTAQVMGRKDG